MDPKGMVLSQMKAEALKALVKKLKKKQGQSESSIEALDDGNDGTKIGAGLSEEDKALLREYYEEQEEG